MINLLPGAEQETPSRQARRPVGAIARRMSRQVHATGSSSARSSSVVVSLGAVGGTVHVAGSTDRRRSPSAASGAFAIRRATRTSSRIAITPKRCATRCSARSTSSTASTKTGTSGRTCSTRSAARFRSTRGSRRRVHGHAAGQQQRRRSPSGEDTSAAGEEAASRRSARHRDSAATRSASASRGARSTSRRSRAS